MFKSTVVKWAVAALLTVPAAPLFANSLHRHKLTSHARAHRVMTATSHHAHRYHRVVHQSAKLSAVKKAAAHRLVASRHHAVRGLASKSATRLKITKTPPTIDNIGA
jgi:hypothetical protein